MSTTSSVAATIDRLRVEVAALHRELVRYGLVVWTAGNISARVPGADLLVIKPSGVPYDELTPEKMVVCDLYGSVVEGDLQPSSDTATSAFVYRSMPDVGGVVHTHSTYATAWASRGESIPCVLTMMADEFGGEIPIGPFAHIGDDEIGRAIVETLQRPSLERHPAQEPRGVHDRQNRQGRRQGGRHVRGRGPQRAHRPSARQSHPDRAGRHRRPLRPLPERVRAAPHDLDRTGQAMTSLIDAHDPRTHSRNPGAGEIWFLTGSQSMYGEGTLRQVEIPVEGRCRDASDGGVATRRASCGSPC